MVCTTCFGNARGCTGNAATCPWVKDVDGNRLALERGNSTAVKTASVLPDYISRLFPPSAIKALVGLSSRPICEVPFDFASNPTMLELVSGVIQNRPPKDDALQYIQRLIGELDPDDSTSPFKLSQYSATIENIRAITPKTVSGTTRTEGARCYILYRCSMGLCGKDLRLESSFEFCDVNDDDTDVKIGKGNNGRTFTASLRRPFSEDQSSSLLNAFVCAGSAFGLFNVLAITPFLETSYYKMMRTVVSWHVAFELTMLYIKKVDLDPIEYNFSNVVGKMGAGDTLLAEATELASEHYPVKDIRSPCFRTRGWQPHQDGNGVYSGELKGFDPSSKLGCYAHTNGTPHLAKHVDKHGKCKFNHGITFTPSTWKGKSA